MMTYIAERDTHVQAPNKLTDGLAHTCYITHSGRTPECNSTRGMGTTDMRTKL